MTFSVSLGNVQVSSQFLSSTALHYALKNSRAPSVAFARNTETRWSSLRLEDNDDKDSFTPSNLSLDEILSLRGGGARGVKSEPVKVDKSKSVKVDKSKQEPPKKDLVVFGVSITPEGRAVVLMAFGMAFHYLGYSLARSITVTLFTSTTTGYADSLGAFPLAMAFVSPLSLLLLMAYGGVLEAHGPRGALIRTTLGCATMLFAGAGSIQAFSNEGTTLFGYQAMKYVTGPLFVFRESYVQLITSQYWSFFSSVLTPAQSAKWFAPITGLTSIASALGGVALSILAKRVRLSGSLACTGIFLMISLLFANRAYDIADEFGFTPTKKKKQVAPVKGKRRGQVVVEEQKKESMMVRAKSLFARVPILGALFWEILASQGLATLLNVCFVTILGTSIPDDTERAGWLGNFYALINIISMALQFFALPFLMQVLEPKNLWRIIPLISLAFTIFQTASNNPTLYMVSGSLLVMKVLEYSARRMLDEMVYVPLDFESRFLGKEIIGVFGYRLGKSLMSLSLSALTSAFGSFDLNQLSALCSLAAAAWARTAWKLSALVPTKDQASETYASTHSNVQVNKRQKASRK